MKKIQNIIIHKTYIHCYGGPCYTRWELYAAADGRFLDVLIRNLSSRQVTDTHSRVYARTHTNTHEDIIHPADNNTLERRCRPFWIRIRARLPSHPLSEKDLYLQICILAVIPIYPREKMYTIYSTNPGDLRLKSQDKVAKLWGPRVTIKSLPIDTVKVSLGKTQNLKEKEVFRFSHQTYNIIREQHLCGLRDFNGISYKNKGLVVVFCLLKCVSTRIHYKVELERNDST